MKKKELYKRIKSELLKDENINKVSLNSVRGLVKIKPSREQYYVIKCVHNFILTPFLW